MAIQSPVNAIPPVVTALVMIIVAVELTLSAGATGLVGGPGGIGWRLQALQEYAVSPAVVDYVVMRGDLSLDLLKRFVTYAFVHGSFTDALFGGALLLALGKFVGDVFHPAATLALFVVSAVAGALGFGLVADGTQPLFGAYPAVYGFIGAFTYILWTRIGQQGGQQIKAFRLIGFLLALQLIFALIFGGTMRWVADLAGFAVGFGASIILAPGGWHALLVRLRQR
ncbi:rhomboid family intramembrane serine protease [Loktanella sp. TSTF-M6]|uniref:Rhomboid family intramembrane serine protease n=1 Tax=Loktanella gaetbuli TaxID=2881335 RepID=A0ABS8BX54_9RHOB|nr:rhomboid family intramembrane serine protease [Loktanella gaetbuli]MCB5200332.1 rhomboid family intramembrane serine protease [Loktanella gaetbuli]